MSHVVGPKGQVVIAKDIREHFGVGRGWIALQRIVDDHVEVRFLPPEHRESLKGSLAPYIETSVTPEDWPEARQRAWDEAVAQRERTADREAPPAP